MVLSEREVCKAGYLQQKNRCKPLKKAVCSPEKYFVFCVHNGRVPLLERYDVSSDVKHHNPEQVVDLLFCNSVTQAIEDERTFLVCLQDMTLEMVAANEDEKRDWIQLLTFKLKELGNLSPGNNVYSPLPFQSSLRSSIDVPLSSDGAEDLINSLPRNEQANRSVRPLRSRNVSVPTADLTSSFPQFASLQRRQTTPQQPSPVVVATTVVTAPLLPFETENTTPLSPIYSQPLHSPGLYESIALTPLSSRGSISLDSSPSATASVFFDLPDSGISHAGQQNSDAFEVDRNRNRCMPGTQAELVSAAFDDVNGNITSSHADSVAPAVPPRRSIVKSLRSSRASDASKRSLDCTSVFGQDMTVTIHAATAARSSRKCSTRAESFSGDSDPRSCAALLTSPKHSIDATILEDPSSDGENTTSVGKQELVGVIYDKLATSPPAVFDPAEHILNSGRFYSLPRPPSHVRKVKSVSAASGSRAADISPVASSSAAPQSAASPATAPVILAAANDFAHGLYDTPSIFSFQQQQSPRGVVTTSPRQLTAVVSQREPASISGHGPALSTAGAYYQSLDSVLAKPVYTIPQALYGNNSEAQARVSFDQLNYTVPSSLSPRPFLGEDLNLNPSKPSNLGGHALNTTHTPPVPMPRRTLAAFPNAFHALASSSQAQQVDPLSSDLEVMSLSDSKRSSTPQSPPFVADLYDHLRSRSETAPASHLNEHRSSPLPLNGGIPKEGAPLFPTPPPLPPRNLSAADAAAQQLLPTLRNSGRSKNKTTKLDVVLPPPPSSSPLPSRAAHNTLDGVKSPPAASELTVVVGDNVQAAAAASKASNASLTVKEAEVLRLSQEIALEEGLKIRLHTKDAAAIAFAEVKGRVWIAGWKQTQTIGRLGNALHLGDQLLAVVGEPVNHVKIAETRINSCHSDKIELMIKRLPLAQCFLLHRNPTDISKDLGIVLSGKRCVITAVALGSVAEKAGVSAKTVGFIDANAQVNVILTEINNRPLSLSAKDDEAGKLLNGAVGKEISIVVQPCDFIAELKKQLKQKRNYRDYYLL